jgi:hypothetical protein
MLRAIGALIFIVLGTTVTLLASPHLPPNYRAGVPFVLLLIAFIGVAWAFAPGRKRGP